MKKTYFVQDLDNTGSQPWKVEAESAKEAKELWYEMAGEGYESNNLDVTGDGFDASNE